MGLFQILLLGTALFFAYKIYEHINNLEEPKNLEFIPDEENKSEILIRKADDAFLVGNKIEAKTFLEKALIDDNNNTDAINKLAYINADMERYEDAIQWYCKSIEIDASNDITYNALGSLYRKMGRFEEAKEHYFEALRIDNTYAVTHFNYGNLLVDMGEIEKASDEYRQAITLDPEFREAKDALKELRRV